MKINYKFNKSSESITCKVESVELDFESDREFIDSSLYVDILNEYATKVIGEDAYLLESDEDIEDYISDFETIIEEETTRRGYELQYIEEPLFDGYFVCFNKIFYTDSMEIQDIKIYKITNDTKTFTNEQDLKDYINSIKEPIEFIGSSSIDDVLLKDWLGEWEYNSKTVKYPIDNQEQGIKWAEDLVTEKVKSPKLNSNWKFKIN